MRHRKDTIKLNRTREQRKALLQNLVNSLFINESIVTTLPKAKAARRIAERIITIGKKGTQHARRLVFARLCQKGTVTKLFQDIAPRFANRNGGYTRIIKTGRRSGDGTQMALLELVEKSVAVEEPKKKEKKPAAKEAVAKAKQQ